MKTLILPALLAAGLLASLGCGKKTYISRVEERPAATDPRQEELDERRRRTERREDYVYNDPDTPEVSPVPYDDEGFEADDDEPDDLLSPEPVDRYSE